MSNLEWKDFVKTPGFVQHIVDEVPETLEKDKIIAVRKFGTNMEYDPQDVARHILFVGDATNNPVLLCFGPSLEGYEWGSHPIDLSELGPGAIDYQYVRWSPYPDLGALGLGSAVFGVSGNLASGRGSFVAGGVNNTSTSQYSHSEGHSTHAQGVASHSEGSQTHAEGNYAHAEGSYAYALHERSHAGGSESQTLSNNDFVRGNGTGNTSDPNNNILRSHGDNGDLSIEGAYNNGGADYAETFEWADGNPDDEDRVGLPVKLSGEKIALAEASDPPHEVIGVISGEPAVLGDAHSLKWKGILQRDAFGRRLTDNTWQKARFEADGVTTDVFRDSDGKLWSAPPGKANPEPTPWDGPELPEKITWEPFEFYKINPDLDPGKTYTPRLARQEFDAVGMLGKLRVIDDGSCAAGGYAKVAGEGTFTGTTDHSQGWKVMRRVSERVVEILFR